MPSLPALPVKNAAFQDGSAFNALHAKAMREYLGRDFAFALATSDLCRKQQLSTKHKRKAFLLYIAILDGSATFSDADTKKKQNREILVGTRALTDGSLWSEAEQYFNGTVPKEVMVSVILILTKHMTDTTKLQDQVEALLTTLEPESSEYDSISELYALHVLPRCNQWENSAIYIESCDFPEDKRLSWLGTLDRIQEAQEKQKQAAIQEAERIRQAELEAKKLRKVRKSRASGSKKSTTSVTASIGPTAESSIMTWSNPDSKISQKLSDHDPAENGSVAASSSALSTLSTWTRALRPRFSPRIMRVLLFLVVLFGATGRREIREKLQGALSKVRTTLSAGFKVSYI